MFEGEEESNKSNKSILFNFIMINTDYVGLIRNEPCNWDDKIKICISKFLSWNYAYYNL
jgi:hypothetical protein